MEQTENLKLIQLAPLDWAVILCYAVFLFGVAFWALPKIKDCGAYFVGSRKMGKLMMVAAAFAGGTNANHPMAVAAASFQKGLSGVWLSLTWMLITPFFWIFPPALRRLRIVTTVDVVRMRYGDIMAFLFKLVQLVSVPVSMALGIKSAAILLEVMTGGAVSGNVAVAAICIPTILYTLMGGVIAAYATDIYQGLLIVLLSFLLIPFAIFEAGSIQALDAGIADELTSLFSGAGNDFGFWWIFWFAIGISFAATVSAASGSAAAKDEFASRMKVFGTILKRFCTVGWGLVGLIAIALFVGHPLLDPASGNEYASADNVFPLAAGELLPVGLRGLMVASIIAAVMSSLDASILYFSSIAVNNIYQEHLVKKASAKHYLFMARLLSVAGLSLGWVFANGVDDLVNFATIVEPMNALTGVAILVALCWRRVTAYGAIASVLVTCPLFLAVNRPDFGLGIPLFELLQLQPVAEWIAGLYQINLYDPVMGYVNELGVLTQLPVQVKYPMFLIPSIVTIIVVSLLTRQHNRRSVDEFYLRLDTPVGEEHKIREAGFTVDELERLDRKDPEIERASTNKHSRLLLVDFFYLPQLLISKKAKLSDYNQDIFGIVGFSIFVVLFLFGVEWVGSLL